MLVQAVRGLDILVRTAWSHGAFGWLPPAPASLGVGTPAGPVPPTVWDLVAYAWIVSFVALVIGRYRTAQVIAALAIVPDLVWLLQGQLTGALPPMPWGPWAFWVLINFAPVLAMTAFHRNAPPTARGPWLAALPAGYVLVAVPLMTLQVTGNSAWLPDFSGLCCVLVALACLAHAPKAWSRQAAGSGVWSLALMMLAAEAGAYRIASLTNYLNDPHLVRVSLVELLIVAGAAALVAPDAARFQGAPAPPRPHPGYPV